MMITVLFVAVGVYVIQGTAGVPRTAVALRVNSSRAIRHDVSPLSILFGQGGGNGQPPCFIDELKAG